MSYSLNLNLNLTPEQHAAHDRATRFRWRDALDSIKRTMADPDDTAQVIRFISAVAGKSSDYVLNRFIAER